ncbi:MAG TPA: hypothetical protein IAB83_01635 [Candidatus Faecousia faecavium]|nr:hypothetical protein [Candidatus Faecousia faecavium]
MKPLIQFSAFALAAVLLLAGCANPQSPSQPTEETATADRHLTISLEADKDADTQFFPAEDLNGNFAYNMQYQRVKDVTITVDGEVLPLETALAQGAVNEEDIFYYARQDARAGICETEVKSRQGVSNFYFHYPEYSLKLIYDVLEAPDGSLPLISSMVLYARKIPGVPGQLEMNPTSHFFTTEAGYLDLEDWGLAFELQQVSPTGATVSCTQSGGQQIGQLSVAYYYLLVPDGSFLEKAEGTEGAPFEKIPLEMDGTTTFSVDWTDWYGTLPSGTYHIMFDVYDLFDPEQVHPLMKDFHDWQQYTVSFTIDE